MTSKVGEYDGDSGSSGSGDANTSSHVEEAVNNGTCSWASASQKSKYVVRSVLLVARYSPPLPSRKRMSCESKCANAIHTHSPALVHA